MEHKSRAQRATQRLNDLQSMSGNHSELPPKVNPMPKKSTGADIMEETQAKSEVHSELRSRFSHTSAFLIALSWSPSNFRVLQLPSAPFVNLTFGCYCLLMCSCCYGIDAQRPSNNAGWCTGR